MVQRITDVLWPHAHPYWLLPALQGNQILQSQPSADRNRLRHRAFASTVRRACLPACVICTKYDHPECFSTRTVESALAIFARTRVSSLTTAPNLRLGHRSTLEWSKHVLTARSSASVSPSSELREAHDEAPRYTVHRRQSGPALGVLKCRLYGRDARRRIPRPRLCATVR